MSFLLKHLIVDVTVWPIFCISLEAYFRPSELKLNSLTADVQYASK